MYFFFLIYSFFALFGFLFPDVKSDKWFFFEHCSHAILHFGWERKEVWFLWWLQHLCLGLRSSSVPKLSQTELWRFSFSTSSRSGLRRVGDGSASMARLLGTLCTWYKVSRKASLGWQPTCRLLPQSICGAFSFWLLMEEASLRVSQIQRGCLKPSARCKHAAISHLFSWPCFYLPDPFRGSEAKQPLAFLGRNYPRFPQIGKQP